MKVGVTEREIKRRQAGRNLRKRGRFERKRTVRKKKCGVG